MGTLLGLIFVFAVLAAIAFALKKKASESKNWKSEEQEEWPYVPRTNVLTEIEQVLYWRILEAMPGMVVLAQVGMSRVLDIPKNTPKRMSWFGKISQKSLDFVICRKDGSIVVAVELDDRSHEGRERKDSDKEKALRAAGVSLIRWNVKNLPTTEEIKQQVAKELVVVRKPI